PDWFARPVGNNSERFDHDEWTRHGAALRIGWRDPKHRSTQPYPGHTGELDPGTLLSFSAGAAEVVLFAGGPLHQARKNGAGRRRFSMGFHTGDLDDHEHGCGAANVDKRTAGSAVRDYVRTLPP